MLDYGGVRSLSAVIISHRNQAKQLELVCHHFGGHTIIITRQKAGQGAGKGLGSCLGGWAGSLGLADGFSPGSRLGEVHGNAGFRLGLVYGLKKAGFAKQSY